MIRSEEHAAWLDDHVEGWKELRPPELARDVITHVPEEDLPDELETEASHDNQSARERGRGAVSERQRDAKDSEELTGEAAEVMAEARAMTQEMHDQAEESDGTATDPDVDADEDDGSSDGNA